MAGYSGTPLLKKLGIKAGFTILVSQEPAAYWDWLSPLPEAVKLEKSNSKTAVDFVHVFVKDKRTFQKLFNDQRKRLKKDGMLWVSWPKKASRVATDLDENVIREFGLKNGLVDVKVCAVDDTWSGLKFVIRLKDR